MECIESRFQITTPTDIKICRGYLCLLHIKFCLLVGETCGLPRANTVRPYRALGKLPYEKEPLYGGFLVYLLGFLKSRGEEGEITAKAGSILYKTTFFPFDKKRSPS